MKRPRLNHLIQWRHALRWRYLLPRMAVVAAIYSVVHWGLDPLLRYSIVATGEAILGAKVDMADLSTSLFDGELAVDGLAAANPQKPFRNLAEAERMHLKFDVGALLRKRVVVTDGLIRGLKFDSERATSGALESSAEAADEGPSMLDPVMTAASDAAVGWLGDLQGRFEEDLEAKLATPRVVGELEDRWKSQYAALQQQADELRAKCKELERDFSEIKKNPLRGMQQLESLQKQLTAVKAELKTTLADIQALPAQAKSDRAAIDAARKQDEEFLRDSLKIAKTDGNQLTEYLLGDTAHGYLASCIGWVQYVRSWVPKTKMERPARARGTNVLFVDRPRPKCLIERVSLAGTAQLGGQPLEFTGLLTDASTEPELHDRPLQLQLVARGAVGGEAHLTIDRRAGASHDALVLDCPHLLLAERTLGNADNLAVLVAPGEASIAAKIELEGEQLTGTIHLKQASTLAAHTPALHDDRIATMLSDSLRGVDRLEADVTLAGTLRRPKVTIDSNVGPQLAEGLSGAARKYFTERRDRLAAKVQGKVDEQLAKLEARRQEAQQELMAKLGENGQVVEQLATLVGENGSLDAAAMSQIGSALKLDRLKR